MVQSHSLVTDGIYVSFFQVLAAAGHLTGIRILTEILPTDVFGTFFLLYGAVVLIATAIANPTMQALLRFYPEYYSQGRGFLPRVVARRQILKLILWILPVILLGIAYFLLREKGYGLTVLSLIALAMTEITRTQSLVLLNATRAQRVYGVWVALEGWSRPLFAGALVIYFNASVQLVILGYLAATALILLLMQRFVPKDDRNVGYPEGDIVDRFWKYTLPILPLGFLGWISGVADRYILGVLLTVADVGTYVAIYGVVSKPFLQVGSTIELAIRPRYYQVLRAGDRTHVLRIERRWLLLVALASVSGILVTFLFHKQISLLLLGEHYRSYSFLMPVIAVGYAMLLLSNFYSRICYARDLTKAVLQIELIGATASIFLAFPFIALWGITGAAAAVPCYFGLQALIAKWLSTSIAAQ